MEQIILESTFTETVTIVGFRDVEKEWGETAQEKITIVENVKCSLGKINSRTFNTEQTDTKNEIHYINTLIISPNVLIEVGDEVTVTLPNGSIREFIAGEYGYYPSHLEVPLKRNGEA